MKTVSADQVLSVISSSVNLKGCYILKDVSFAACSGDLLAVMGESGSGKTTLMNVIAGRQTLTSGKITLDGAPFGKQLRRRLGYVLQNDIFFSNLTLWETLYFTAMIRLPERLSREEKLKRINEIVDILDIRKCLHTVMGDMFTMGLSGGEKKRASVACELLTDPDILLLDEPTSGLDSSTSLKLVKQLKDFAVTLNKTILVTIHQPSSQTYHLFDNLLLLTRGQVAYFGKGHGVPLDFLGKFGFTCDALYNPADFMLPSERGLISKERLAGAYRLSAFYLARTVSELPLTIVIPTLYFAFVYWMAGLNDVTAFFMTWPILVLSVISIQVTIKTIIYAFI
ncbi:uncharacterized protein LOC127844677 [Dreissena polymorpha]|uniref:uncharacterized protein LOC127844677 n=1 Tax=Dreissena polymorpha TaxID=45954 RepID=UPI0022641438|nr:uncharacterized protein LOC127844677 [Dreissena polymorpha]